MKKFCHFLGAGIICILLFCSCGIQHYRNTEYLDLGDINKYSIIAVIDDGIAYNYFNENGDMVIGKYDYENKIYNDICLVNDFYLSAGIPAIIDKKMYYPVTLTNVMHNLYEIDLSCSE